MQDCKSVRVAIMISATLVNTQTHTHSLITEDSFD